MTSIHANSVTIVNRNYPPHPGITGACAAELAAFLTGKGVAVNVVHVDAPYEGKTVSASPAGEVIRVNTFYNGKNKLIRLFANLFEGFLLIWKAKRLKAGVIICMTDPPLLNFWAALLLQRRKWILWAMDLYPEAFVAAGLVSGNNPVYRFIDRLVANRPPWHIIALGSVQAAYLQMKYKTPVSISILPAGVLSVTAPGPVTAPPVWATRDKIILGYCGNLGEAHSPEFLYAIIDGLDHSKYHLVLSAYGVHAKKLRDYAQGKPGVFVLPFLPAEEMRLIDIHLASLKPAWANVCVPSKVLTSICMGGAFVYFGPEQSDNWQMPKKAGWLLSQSEDFSTSIPGMFNSLTREAINRRKQEALQLAEDLLLEKRRAMDDIYTRIKLQ
ncbi:glycosyltransferase family 4 protein [Hufsiella ginkgonis]|uniref:Glycosyltransferase n=1 Tax=Hufsiella ginkgonis TaxID=2695274 RepID=A0A7K1Y3V7_9SPHI|nr:glycosyltransferase family 4 protein [Hufsiella ginkgonis]MXV17376.1 hypothetical protein [Hufsiella ginkgonis]